MLPIAVKNATLENLKELNIDLYNQVFALGQESKNDEISALKAENQKLKDEAEIRKNAFKLGLVEEGEKLISENKSVSEALSSLIQKSIEKPKEQQASNELKGIFEKTAPDAAGAGSEGDVTIDTKEKAITFIKKTKNPKTNAEAVRMARQEYPQLFVGHILKGGEII